MPATAQALIDRTDELRPNTVSFEMKLHWLSCLDQRAYEEVIARHEGAGTCQPLLTGQEELLIPPPYDEVYHHYLAMQMDLAGREIAAYNNDRALFNSAWITWQDAYNRAHMPLTQAERWTV